MANHSFSIDLLALMGAQYVNGKKRAMRPGETPESYAKVPLCPGIFIPCASNEIQVVTDNSDPMYRNMSGFKAYLRAFMYVLSRKDNQKLFESIESRLLKDGKQPDDFNVPSHEVRTSYSEEYKTKLLEAAKMVEVAAHPEWANLDFEERTPDGRSYVNRDYRAAVYSHIPSRLGMAYTVKPKDYVAPAPTATATLSPITEAPADAGFAFPPMGSGEVGPIDDLPF